MLSIRTRGQGVAHGPRPDRRTEARVREPQQRWLPGAGCGATKELPGKEKCAKEDERELVLKGYVAFPGPAQEDRGPAIEALHKHGVAVKILTGDNQLISRKVCGDVGLAADPMLLGGDVEKMSDAELADAAEKTTLFARLSPAHKERVIRAPPRQGHVVGFMGDGINDAPALRAADVGISVDTATDIAKESADLILLEKDLMVLEEGVIEGREGLREHRQVHPHGGELQFRQHVQRAGGQRLPALPAHGPDSGVDQ